MGDIPILHLTISWRIQNLQEYISVNRIECLFKINEASMYIFPPSTITLSMKIRSDKRLPGRALIPLCRHRLVHHCSWRVRPVWSWSNILGPLCYSIRPLGVVKTVIKARRDMFDISAMIPSTPGVRSFFSFLTTIVTSLVLGEGVNTYVN